MGVVDFLSSLLEPLPLLVVLLSPSVPTPAFGPKRDRIREGEEEDSGGSISIPYKFDTHDSGSQQHSIVSWRVTKLE